MPAKIKIPFQAKSNVVAALVANYLNKNNKCATKVGKKRSSQIIKDDYLSLETAKRTYSYLSRAKVYDKKDWNTCGTISYNLWGGDAMLDHLKKVLKK